MTPARLGTADRWRTVALPAAYVAAAALLAASPALRLPLISDDWVNLDAVTDEIPWQTPFRYVRPVYMALFGWGRSFWGLTAWPYHAVSLALFTICALLVFELVRRLSGDRRLAVGAGVVFAVHPFSIEATAWVSSWGDLLACAFGLGSLVAWDRWRASRRPVDLGAVFALFSLALLSKESAVVVPALIVLMEICRLRAAPRPRGVLAALAALAAVAVGHMLVLRPILLGVAGDALPRVHFKRAIANAVLFSTATVLPLPAEILEFHYRAWAAVAGVAIVSLVVAAWRAAGRLPVAGVIGAIAAAIAGVPALFAFQERYFLFASAGVAVSFVALVLACKPRVRLVVGVAAGIVWAACAALQWAEWHDAGRASEALVAGLSRSAALPETREIVIANLPHRVHGAPVVTDLAAIVRLVVGRDIPVALATRVDFGTAVEDGLDAEEGSPVSRDGDDLVVRLRIPDGLYRRFVRPIVTEGQAVSTQGGGRVSRTGGDRYVVRIPNAESSARAVLVWYEGALIGAEELAPRPPRPRSISL